MEKASEESLAKLKARRDALCGCGEAALFFRLHSSSCRFFQELLKEQESLESSERYEVDCYKKLKDGIRYS